MMGIGWAASQNSGREGLASEVLVVRLGQTSKPVDMLILPSVATNNQLGPQPTEGADNRKFSLIRVGLGLESDQAWECPKKCRQVHPFYWTQIFLIPFSCYLLK